MVDAAEVGGAASIARPPEVGPPSSLLISVRSRYGPAPRQSPDFGREVARSARLTSCAQDTERSLGARHGSRLQRSVRSIFPVACEASREAS